VLFVCLALDLASNITAGKGMAGVAFPYLLPLLFLPSVAFGFLFRLAVEHALKRNLAGRDFLPWSLPVVLGIIGIAWELSYPGFPRCEP
jgi:hypothetical protein